MEKLKGGSVLPFLLMTLLISGIQNDPGRLLRYRSGRITTFECAKYSNIMKPFCCIALLMMLMVPSTLFSQPIRPVYFGNNCVIIRQGTPPGKIFEMAANVTPSANQLEWQHTEFNAFIHFGINTFTGREWGDGHEDPALFNPVKFDARQWVSVIRDAGMKMVIFTAKHHDGFCLWPSAFTRHSVAASKWKGGKGDVVGEVAAACREYGLKFGFYLSPWDRHEPSYGNSEAYNEFFRNQLRELLTRYGDIAEVWFDGACGEGADGRKQVYDWKSWYAIIRELQPGAVIAVMGPDVRWVGTESGYGRETEWSVIPDVLQTPDSTVIESDRFPVDKAFIPGDRMAQDLGSLDNLAKAGSLVWYPSETDVSIRPGWFYHPDENKKVKSPEKLADIYFHSVGRNSVLLLNIPPGPDGLIHKRDIKSLNGLRKLLDGTFRNNLIAGASISPSGNAIEYAFSAPVTFNVALIQEDVKVGQRIEKFHLEAWDGNGWSTIATGTTVGNKRLLRFPKVSARKIRFVTDESRAEPAIMNIGIYQSGIKTGVE